ncbi:MAG: uroporphyrinogen decarboxylase family protein [Planctomycetota bacterium]
MNSFERYAAALRGGTPDCAPRVPILMAFAADWIGSDYAAFASDHRVLVEANLRCAEAFDFDQVSTISDPYRETQGFGAAIEYVPDGPPRCAAPPLAETKDLAALADPDPQTSGRMRDRVAAVEAFAAAVGGARSILGWVEGPAAEAADLRGVTTFLMDLFDDPAFADALMDRCTEVAVAFACAQLAAGADTVGIGDAIASQLAPDQYARFVLPRERRIVDAVHAAGGWVRLHICGNITHLLPHIATLGVDIVDCDWQVDLADARRALGPGVCLTGNLDPAEAVLRSTPDRIRADLRAAAAAAGRPWMAGAGCEIPLHTPPEHLRALCEPVPWV